MIDVLAELDQALALSESYEAEALALRAMLAAVRERLPAADAAEIDALLAACTASDVGRPRRVAPVVEVAPC